MDRPVLTNRPAMLGVSLKDQHDHVVAEVSRGDRAVKLMGTRSTVICTSKDWQRDPRQLRRLGF